MNMPHTMATDSGSSQTWDLMICVATGQNLANVLPALQIPSHRIWVLATGKMEVSAKHLRDALKAPGTWRKAGSIDPLVSVVPIDDSSVEALEKAANDLIVRILDLDDVHSVVVNITGGTKLLTLALHDHLVAALKGDEHLPLGEVYVNTARSRLEWHSPFRRDEPMAPVLTINGLLLTQGYRQIGGADKAYRQRTADERRPLTTELGKLASEHAKFIGALNGAAVRALNDAGTELVEPLQSLGVRRLKAPEAGILDTAQHMGFLVREDGDRIRFTDASSACYLCGLWLEDLVTAKLGGLKPDGDWAMSLEVTSDGEARTNEIDAIAVHRNRVLVIECKTANMNRKGRAADAIYKLAQVSRTVGGSLVTPLLVSVRDLSAEDRRRADEYGIQVLAGSDISRLSRWLRDWMNQP